MYTQRVGLFVAGVALGTLLGVVIGAALFDGAPSEPGSVAMPGGDAGAAAIGDRATPSKSAATDTGSRSRRSAAATDDDAGFPPASGTGVIAVRVVTRDGVPVEGATVSARIEAPWPSQPQSNDDAIEAAVDAYRARLV